MRTCTHECCNTISYGLLGDKQYYVNRREAAVALGVEAVDAAIQETRRGVHLARRGVLREAVQSEEDLVDHVAVLALHDP